MVGLKAGLKVDHWVVPKAVQWVAKMVVLWAHSTVASSGGL